MKIDYSDHAEKRIKQRGITKLEIEHILKYPTYIKKSFEGTKEASGEFKNRIIKIKFIETENYIRIITIIWNMKFEYDKEVDAGYIYIEHPIKEGEAKKTIELNENIILDFDDKGKLLGVEILNASKVLNKKTLLEAQSA